MKKKNLCYSLILAFSLMAATAFTVFAAMEVPLVPNGEDDNKGFRYEMGNLGGIYSGLEEGETGKGQTFTVDDSLDWKLFRDDEEEKQEEGAMFMDPGSYRLELTPKGDNPEDLVAYFTFTIENDFGMMLNLTEFTESEIPDKTPTELSYDTGTHQYIYTLPNGKKVRMNIPNGAVTTDPVLIEVEDPITDLLLLVDGEAYTCPEKKLFREPGTYELSMLCTPTTYTGKNINSYEYHVYFQILDEGLLQSTVVNAPEHFTIDKVFMERKPYKPTDDLWTYLQYEGVYAVSFEADTAGVPSYDTAFRKDTIAPVLTFSQPINAGKIKGPLEFTCSDPDSTITGYFNGYEIGNVKSPLQQGGSYTLEVKDRVGNSRSYSFYIKTHHKFFTSQMIVLLGVIILFAGCYIWLKRRDLQV